MMDVVLTGILGIVAVAAGGGLAWVLTGILEHRRQS